MTVLDDLGMTADDLREALRDGPPPERSPLLSGTPDVSEVDEAMAARDRLRETLDAACAAGEPWVEFEGRALLEAAERRVSEAVDRHLAPEPRSEEARARQRVRVARAAAGEDSPLVRMAVRELERVRRAATRTAAPARTGRRRRHTTAELLQAFGIEGS